MPSDRKPLLVRLPEDLLEDLRRLAAAELRSVNAEVEYLLRDAIRRRKSSGQKAEPSDES